MITTMHFALFLEIIIITIIIIIIIDVAMKKKYDKGMICTHSS